MAKEGQSGRADGFEFGAGVFEALLGDDGRIVLHELGGGDEEDGGLGDFLDTFFFVFSGFVDEGDEFLFVFFESSDLLHFDAKRVAKFTQDLANFSRETFVCCV